MSRRKKRRGASAELVPSASPQLSELTLVPNAFGGFGLSGYQGAQWSPDRGMIYWPTLDARREIDTYSRTEIARKVHMLCANFGLPRRVFAGLTNLVIGSGLRPQATTTDTEWNELAEERYNTRAASPLTYSVTGRLTAVQMQRLAYMTRLKDGDAAVVFSESQSGGALRKLYSGLQIGNAGETDLDQSRWIDGLFLDSLERIQLYRFPDADGPGFKDLPASAVRFLCRREAPGQLRGISALAHGVNRVIDIGEIWRYVTQGIKNSQEIGYYLASDAADQKQALGIKAVMEGRTVAIDTPQGKVNVQLSFGNGGKVPALPPGYDIKTLLDNRPAQNQREFVDEALIRDLCHGLGGVSSDLLWNIYKLGGANVRFVLADAQVFVATEQQDLVDSWLSADWIYSTAKDMQAGRLRRCKDPHWWRHGWVPPARVTVDFGRDGNIFLRWYQAGLITCERLYAMHGQDAREELKKELDLVAWHKAEMKRLRLDWNDLKNFRGLNAAALPVPEEDLKTQEALEEAAAGKDPEETETALAA